MGIVERQVLENKAPERPEVPTGLSHAIYPECFSSAPVNHTFLIEYAKKMFFSAAAATVHTLWPENASHFMEMVKKHRKSV